MRKLTPCKLKKILFESIDQLLENKDKYLANPRTDFSRTQKISFRDTMLFPMIAANESTSVEMLDFFSASELPTQAAMSYRRDQVNTDAFKNLFTGFTAKLPQKKTFRGMHLIACDGTRLNTPYDPSNQDSYVKCIENRKGFNQYHLVTCYDVLNEVFKDAIIQGYHSMNETLAFITMMEDYPKNEKALFTADRGFASYNVIAHAINNGHHFLIRTQSVMAKGIFRDTNNVFESDFFDIEDEIYIGRVRTREFLSLNNYHYIGKQQPYDYIAPKDKKIDHFHIRLVKIILPGGESEYLLTDLPQSSFSTSDLKEIYRLRWGIETSFRYLKYASSLTHIHALKPAFIFQEIFSKLTLYNFCSAVDKTVAKENRTDLKHKYSIERTYLIKICIRFLKGKLRSLLDVIQKRKVPVRTGRKFARNLRTQHADTLQYK